MQVSKQEAAGLLSALGFKATGALSLKRLQGKINKLNEVVDDDTDVEDEVTNAMLKDVLQAIQAGETIEVTIEEEEEEPKAAGGDSKPKTKRASGGRGTKGRPYFAGQVIHDYGCDEVTAEMVEQVDIRCGRPNPKESEAWLKLARNVVLGFVSKKEVETV